MCLPFIRSETPLRSVVKFDRLGFEEEPLESHDPTNGRRAGARVATVEGPWIVGYPLELHQTPRLAVSS